MDTSRCIHCIHGTTVSDPAEANKSIVACVYILNTYTRRPCRPGKQCTVYAEGNRTIASEIARKAKNRNVYQQRVAEFCCGRQRAALTAYMAQTGYVPSSLAKKLGITVGAVYKWLDERAYADWEALRRIGMETPDFAYDRPIL